MDGGQRYCLNCGARAGEPRVAFQEQLFSGGSDNGVAQASATSRGWNPLAAAALLGLLGIMLLVGVLIGKDENDEQPASTAPAAQTTPAPGVAVTPTTPTPPPSSTIPPATGGDQPAAPPITPGGAAEDQDAQTSPDSSRAVKP
jgi:hypothetical protein